jgi:hypothetical protein
MALDSKIKKFTLSISLSLLTAFSVFAEDSKMELPVDCSQKKNEQQDADFWGLIQKTKGVSYELAQVGHGQYSLTCKSNGDVCAEDLITGESVDLESAEFAKVLANLKFLQVDNSLKDVVEVNLRTNGKTNEAVTVAVSKAGEWAKYTAAQDELRKGDLPAEYKERVGEVYIRHEDQKLILEKEEDLTQLGPVASVPEQEEDLINIDWNYTPGLHIDMNAMLNNKGIKFITVPENYVEVPGGGDDDDVEFEEGDDFHVAEEEDKAVGTIVDGAGEVVEKPAEEIVSPQAPSIQQQPRYIPLSLEDMIAALEKENKKKLEEEMEKNPFALSKDIFSYDTVSKKINRFKFSNSFQRSFGKGFAKGSQFVSTGGKVAVTVGSAGKGRIWHSPVSMPISSNVDIQIASSSDAVAESSYDSQIDNGSSAGAEYKAASLDRATEGSASADSVNSVKRTSESKGSLPASMQSLVARANEILKTSDSISLEEEALSPAVDFSNLSALKEKAEEAFNSKRDKAFEVDVNALNNGLAQKEDEPVEGFDLSEGLHTHHKQAEKLAKASGSMAPSDSSDEDDGASLPLALAGAGLLGAAGVYLSLRGRKLRA